MPAKPVKVGVINMNAMVGYFRSVAMAIEIQNNTKTVWRTYNESTALNIMYSLLPWKEKPGTLEVVQDWRAIEARTQTRTAHFLDTFHAKLASGPSTALTYAEQMHALRQSALMSVQETFASSASVNAQVAKLAGEGARTMANVQFGCTIVLATTGCLLAMGATVPVAISTSSLGLKAAAVGLGYNIVGALVKDSVSLKSAQAIAIETGKTGTGEFLGRAVPSAQTALAEKIAANSGQIDATKANIAKLNQQLARKTSQAKIAKLNAEVAAKREGIRRAESELAKNSMKSGAATLVSKGVPLVFLAHDIWNAWSDRADVYAATQ